MKILDRYILRQFLTTFVFVVGVLLAVIVVIDITERNEDFLRNKPPLEAIVFDYYLNFIPYYGNLLSPLLVFIATVFVTSRLAARTEIVAMVSAGVSFPRLLVPYTIGAVMIGLLTFYLVSYVIPNGNKKKIAFELKYVRQPFYFDKRNIHFKVAQDDYVSLESYNNAIHTGYQFTLEKIKGNKLISKLSAERISWNAEKKQWNIYNYRVRSFDSLGVESIRFGQAIDTVLNMKPTDFESNYLRYETMTTPELESFIENEQLRGAENIAPYLVEKYLRTTYPFATLILTMIGVILSARKSREGPGFQVALGFILAFLYVMFFIMSRSIAQQGDINPLLACWLPNLIFTSVGIGLYKFVPR